MIKLWSILFHGLRKNRLVYWLDHKIKRDTFELRGDVIIRGRGKSDSSRVRIGEIESWVDHDDPWIFVVSIKLNNGRWVEWEDPHMELEQILRRVAGERMIQVPEKGDRV